MSESRDDRELAEDAAALARELRELRTELARQRPEPPRGPFGVPRPPTPREFVKFADEVAIPATIALLETNIKLLEALQRAIRLAEGGQRARERGEAAGKSAHSRAESLSRETLGRASDALAELQSVLAGTELPEDETARSILEEARDIRAEIQRQLGASRREDHSLDEYTRGSESGTRDGSRESGGRDGVSDGHGDEQDGGDEGAADEPVEIDVDAELETLRRRYGDADGGNKSNGADAGNESNGADGEGDSSDEAVEDGPDDATT
ncbi:DUF7547 family protein [Haloarchaeobius sp. TZWWS8]|uniref:DUF7547 family protein n=1 Tax=Haloarchaeobius sp. TZWWS8 TaxID=3446121 RepID=UPI003EB9CD5C